MSGAETIPDGGLAATSQEMSHQSEISRPRTSAATILPGANVAPITEGDRSSCIR